MNNKLKGNFKKVSKIFYQLDSQITMVISINHLLIKELFETFL